MRYALLTAMAESIGARYVAVGHTRDDQAETVLFRMMRGTGARGLAGIPRTRPLSSAVTLVRPLLEVWRADIKNYLVLIGQEARRDATNADWQFTRNRIRHDVLPRLSEKCGYDAAAALARLADEAGEAQRIIESAAAALLSRCQARTTYSADGRGMLALRTVRLAGESDDLVRESLRVAWRSAGFGEQAMTRQWWRDLATLALNKGAAPRHLPGGVTARHDDEWLILERL